jgi:reductive dehalogenase
MPRQKKSHWRAFLQEMGFPSLSNLSLPAVYVVGRVGNDELVVSPEEYGAFVIRRHSQGDPPYQVDGSMYERFDQKHDLFSRLSWDVTLRENFLSEAPKAAAKRMKANKPGSSRLDFAFYTAAWTVASTLGTMSGSIDGAHRGLYSIAPLPDSFMSTFPLMQMGPWEPENLSSKDISVMVKKAARFYGASLVGIAPVEERWIYSRSYGSAFTNIPETAGRSAPIVFEDVEEPVEHGDGTLIIPRRMKYVIALAFEMDQEAIATSIAGPQAAASGLGYSRMAFTAGTLAEFLRGLGYHAIPCGNNTALSIPIAIDAGLGELGRNGLLITPKYGPRVRLAKIFTDLPLAPDQPISFGVQAFCEVCGKCAQICPGGAILPGRNARTYAALTSSNNPGVYKWPVDAEKCQRVWCHAGHDCAVCIRVCPFNRPTSWLHRATQTLISAGAEHMDQFLVELDTWSEEGKRASPEEFWEPEQRRPVRKKARIGRDTRWLSVKQQPEAAVTDELVKGREKEGEYDDDRYAEGTSTP